MVGRISMLMTVKSIHDQQLQPNFELTNIILN